MGSVESPSRRIFLRHFDVLQEIQWTATNTMCFYVETAHNNYTYEIVYRPPVCSRMADRKDKRKT